jgi:hypothetical protein
MSTTLKYTSATTHSNLIAQASLNALGIGSYATGMGSLITNTAKNLLIDIELILSSGVTCGTGTPRVDVWIVPSLDGSGVPTPPGTGSVTSTNAPPGTYFAGSILAIASQSFTRGILKGVEIPKDYFGIVIQNNLGVAFPSTNTCSISGYSYSVLGE